MRPRPSTCSPRPVHLDHRRVPEGDGVGQEDGPGSPAPRRTGRKPPGRSMPEQPERPAGVEPDRCDKPGRRGRAKSGRPPRRSPHRTPDTSRPTSVTTPRIRGENGRVAHAITETRPDRRAGSVPQMPPQRLDQDLVRAGPWIGNLVEPHLPFTKTKTAACMKETVYTKTETASRFALSLPLTWRSAGLYRGRTSPPDQVLQGGEARALMTGPRTGVFVCARSSEYSWLSEACLRCRSPGETLRMPTVSSRLHDSAEPRAVRGGTAARANRRAPAVPTRPPSPPPSPRHPRPTCPTQNSRMRCRASIGPTDVVAFPPRPRVSLA